MRIFLLPEPVLIGFFISWSDGIPDTPVHPGEILNEEFLKPLGISQRAFAKTIGVPPNRVNEIIRGRRSVTGDTAIRFGYALGTTPEMWLRLQSRYELEKALDEEEPDLKNQIKSLVD